MIFFGFLKKQRSNFLNDVKNGLLHEIHANRRKSETVLKFVYTSSSRSKYVESVRMDETACVY